MVKQRKSKEELAVPPPKTNDLKAKPTPEQLRVAQILEKKITDPLIKLKLKQIMDATQRPADEVYVALHDSDFDADQAVDLLIEGKTQDDWCLSKNKKKKVQESKEKKTEERLAVEQNGDSTRPPNSSFGRKTEERGKPGRDRGPRNGEVRQRLAGDELTSNARGRGFRGGRGQRSPRLPPGTMVFERSVNQETVQPDQTPNPAGLVSKAPLRNQWEKPLISSNSVEEDWDNEEFTGSLSQTQIFTSSLKADVSKGEILEDIEDLGERSVKAGLESFNEPQQLTTLVVKPSVPPQPVTAAPATIVAPPASALPKPISADSALFPNKLTYASLTSEVYSTPVSTSLFTQAKEKPTEPRSLVLPARTSLPAEPRPDLFYRLTFPKNLSDHQIVSAKKPPPSKIPTSAVEMPPEAMPSLSHLDIEFGAIDLGPSATDTDSIDSFSAPVSQSPSSSGLLHPTSEAQSTGGSQYSRSTISSGNASSTLNNFSLSNAVPSISSTVTQSAPSGTSSVNTHYHQSANQMFPSAVTTTSSVQNLSGINSHHFMSQNSLNYGSSTSSLGLMSAPDTIPSSNVNHVTLGHVVVPAPSHLTSAAPNHLTSAAGAPQSHMLNSSVSPQPVTQPMGVGRYMSSSNQQSYNAHLQYGYMSSQPYDSRPLQSHLQQHETNTSMPPPHMSQPPPLPPAFKHTPPGIPKGNSGNGPPLVANLPPPMVNPNHHQYIGNMPYFSHQPIFYYEEMPPVLNSQQQRLAHHHMSQGYDTSNYHHQTSNSASNRDGVHYNV